MLAHAKHAQDDLAAVLADQHDFHASGAHDEQRIARVVFKEDDAAARIRAFAGEFREGLQLSGAES
ncbi:hypothetical protein D3C83_321780 [compost metagenome]